MQTSNSSQNQTANKVKVVFLGDHSTGKTSIISRFLNDRFDQECNATVGIDFLAKNVFLSKCIVRLQLWDTAGQERFRSLIPNYLKDAMIAILVFDVGTRSTFDNLAEWYELFKENKHPHASIVLVGNKIDLPRVVSKEEALKKADALGMKYFETSAKVSTNVQNLFTQVAKLYATQNLKESNIIQNLSEKQQSSRQIPKENIKIKEQLPYQLPQKTKRCCQ